MTISTYAELKIAIASWGKRADLTDLLPDFVLSAHGEIVRTLRTPLLQAIADVTINAERVAVPSDFREAIRLYIDVTPRRQVQPTSGANRSDLAALYVTTTYPTHYAVEGRYFTFAPVPSGSSTGKLLYYAAPTFFASDGATNDILTRHPFLYLEGALAELYRYIEDDNMADRYETRFRARIEAINQSENMDAMGGPLQGSPYPGGIV